MIRYHKADRNSRLHHVWYGGVTKHSGSSWCNLWWGRGWAPKPPGKDGYVCMSCISALRGEYHRKRKRYMKEAEFYRKEADKVLRILMEIGASGKPRRKR